MCAFDVECLGKMGQIRSTGVHPYDVPPGGAAAGIVARLGYESVFGDTGRERMAR
jgi:hypothetical protein